MERMITGGRGGPFEGRRGCKSLEISGLKYANTAARFWSSLIDEVRHDYPECSALVLSAPSGIPLSEEHLDPIAVLEKTMNALFKTDTTAALEESVRNLELFGPPASVLVKIMKADNELFAGELAPDIADEEIFMCLLCWLLKWGDIPEPIWNSEFIDGAFLAESPVEHRTYNISFSLHNEHLSEGLFRRKLTLKDLSSE